MKTRLKNKAEKKFDSNELENNKDEFLKTASEFASEFSDMEGDVYFSTYQKFQNSHWHYDRSLEVMAMKKVGDEWDYSKGITGAYRYRGI